MFERRRRHHHVRQPHLGPEREIIEDLDGDAPILRPANYPPGAPGRGIVTLQGPDRAQPAGPHLHGRRSTTRFAPPTPLLDEHARRRRSSSTCTPRRRARRSRWAGTSTGAWRPSRHAHARADGRRAHPAERHGVRARRRHVRARATASSASRSSASHRHFLTGMPTRLPVAEKPANVIFNSVLIDIDDATGRATIDRARGPGAHAAAMPAKGDFHTHSTASDGA